MGPELKEWLNAIQSLSGRTAIVGNVKNAGKTTLLNWLLEKLPGVPSAVTSAGLDGEAIDLVERTIKPRVKLPGGVLFATGASCLDNCQGRWERLALSEIETALGKVWICRTLSPCLVELAGPTRVSELRLLLDRLASMGAERIWVDGAIDRTAFASVKSCDQMIAAAGCAGSINLEQASDRIESFAERLLLPAITEPEASRSLRKASLMNEDLDELADRRVLLPDFSACLVDSDHWNQIRQGRPRVMVEESRPVLALFISSFRPHRLPIDATRLLSSMRERCHRLPVFDLFIEGEIPC